MTETTSVLSDVIHHFALMVNGIAVRFKAIRGTGYVIDVLLAGIFIAQVIKIILVFIF